MFKNIGKTNKIVGLIIWWASNVAAAVMVILAIVFAGMKNPFWYFALAGSAGVIIMGWPVAFLIYGFGELLEKNSEIVKNTSSGKLRNVEPSAQYYGNQHGNMQYNNFGDAYNYSIPSQNQQTGMPSQKQQPAIDENVLPEI